MQLLKKSKKAALLAILLYNEEKDCIGLDHLVIYKFLLKLYVTSSI